VSVCSISGAGDGRWSHQIVSRSAGVDGTGGISLAVFSPLGLAEFEYRFNRRYDLAAMMPRLGYV
jgi:hypothetical protein